MQRALLQFDQRKNWPLIREALKIAHREDLIGPGKDCLVPGDSGLRDARPKSSQPREKARERTGSKPARSADKAEKPAGQRAKGKPSMKGGVHVKGEAPAKSRPSIKSGTSQKGVASAKSSAAAKSRYVNAEGKGFGKAGGHNSRGKKGAGR